MSEKSKIDAERAKFQEYMLGREHPVFGWIDGHWFGIGDDPATYANDYVQGCWVMWQARASLPVSVPTMADVDRYRIELLPEHDAGYVAKAYVEESEPVAEASGFTAVEAVREVIGLLASHQRGEA